MTNEAKRATVARARENVRLARAIVRHTDRNDRAAWERATATMRAANRAYGRVKRMLDAELDLARAALAEFYGAAGRPVGRNR